MAIGAGVQQKILGALRLTTCSKDEMEKVFDDIDTNKDGRLSREEVQVIIENLLKPRLEAMKSPTEAIREVQQVTGVFMTRFDDDKSGDIDRDEFKRHVTDLAGQVNPQVYPLAASMFLTMLPIGVIVPLEPQLVRDLGINVAEFGFVVSAMGMSKLIFNIPATDIVERKGRKPILVGSYFILGLSVAGLGLSTSMEHLFLCRLLTGVSVAGLASAVITSISDLSTPLNRARTMAPLQTCMNAGVALGPAVGGVLASYLGMTDTFFLVGGCLAATGLVSHLLVHETMLRPPSELRGITSSFTAAFSSWQRLIAGSREVKILCSSQTLLWVVMAGAQSTMLPLFLAGPELAFSSATIGMTFAGMATVGVFATQPLAAVADKYGRRNALVAGSGVLACSMALVPHLGSPALVCGVLGSWALGQNVIGPSINALMIDTVIKQNPADVPQALSLLRTCSDVGLLAGASSVGTLAMHFGMTTGFECCAAMLILMAGATHLSGVPKCL